MQHDALYVPRARRALFAPRGESDAEMSLKTADSLLYTDEPALSVAELTDISQEDVQGHHDRSKNHVYFAEQRSQASQRKQRTEASGGSFNGPIADVALVACGMSSTLFFAQNASSRSNCDTKLPLYRSLPLNVKYIVDIKNDLTRDGLYSHI